MDDDAALMPLLRSIALGDGPRASQLLKARPELATAQVRQGAARNGPDGYFFDEIKHYAYRGDTALHLAGAAYLVAFARELVAAGASVAATNRRGAQPLHYAVDGGPGARRWDPRAQRETVSCLIELGADPDATDKSGTTPLLRAIRNRCASAVAALLEGGANPRATNKSGSTALQLAGWTTGRGGSGSPEARAEQEEIVELLHAAGAA